MEILEAKEMKLSKELRENRREKMKEQQEFNRLSAFEKNRFAENEIVSEDDIKGLCSRIKRRKRADIEDLKRFADAFLQAEANITAFIKVTGALNIIIKEFTGNDRSKQMLAAQCLCNLSLGDETSCAKIATFAGSYLMIFMMNSSDTSFSTVCIWIVQNIVAAGSKPMNILMSQELLKNSMHVLNGSVEHKQEALQLLDLIIGAKSGEMSTEEMNEIHKTLWNLLQKNQDDPMLLQLLIKVSGSSNFTEEQSEQLTAFMAMNFIDVLSPDYDESLLPFALKLLSKSFLSNSQNITKFLETLLQKNIKISEVINRVVATPKHFAVIKQLLQFIAFIHIYRNPIVVQYFTFDPPSAWKVPKLFEF